MGPIMGVSVDGLTILLGIFPRGTEFYPDSPRGPHPIENRVEIAPQPTDADSKATAGRESSRRFRILQNYQLGSIVFA